MCKGKFEKRDRFVESVNRHFFFFEFSLSRDLRRLVRTKGDRWPRVLCSVRSNRATVPTTTTTTTTKRDFCWANVKIVRLAPKLNSCSGR